MDSANARAFPPDPVAFEDGLGQRRVTTGAAGEMLEVLTIREELATPLSFETSLRDRANRLVDFRSEHYGRVRAIERIGKGAPRLSVVSDHVPGLRLSEILSTAERQLIPVETNAAFCLIRQMVHAAAILHDKAPDTCHGAIGPERLIVTPQARLVVVEYVLGSALEQLRYSNKQYWQELRVPMPRTFGMPNFDRRADVTQLGVAALALIIGRPLTADEYPAQVAEMTDSALVLSANGGLEPLPLPLKVWLQRAMQIDSKTPFGSALEAWAELDRVLHYSDPIAEAESLKLFLSRYDAQAKAPSPTPRAADPGRGTEKRAAVTTPAPVKPAVLDRPVIAPKPVAPAKTAEPNPVAPISPAPKPAAVVEPMPVRPVATRPAPAAAPVVPAIPEMPGADTLPPETAPFATMESLSDPVVKEKGGFWSRPAPSQEPEEAVPVPVARQSVPAATRWSRMRLTAAVALLVALASGLTLTARRYFMQPVSADGMGMLVIQTNPAGAKVTIDGEAHGVTPVSLDLTPGHHTLKLSSEGSVRSMPVTITAGGQVSQFVDMPRAPSVLGELRVRTDPAGAMVTVDGHEYGKSPVTVEGLSPGVHSVVLASARGSITQDVKIEAGTTASLVVPLTPPANVPVSGWIAVKAPAELEIYEDGRLLGSSQSERIMVPVGRHDIQVVNEAIGFHETQTVEVRPGRVAVVQPQWPTGTMSFNAVPWAEVWVDGQQVGETPLANVTVPIGPHTIMFRHPDLGERNVTATVTADTPAKVSVDLRQK